MEAETRYLRHSWEHVTDLEMTVPFYDGRVTVMDMRSKPTFITSVEES
jgi:hypothetical protein